mgnify:CR=1 FL=1|jgi:hypothetical protein
MKNKKFVVYTALFGNYDNLLEPAPSKDCDYICFTDDPLLKSDLWEIQVVTCRLSAKMMNRLHKIKPHVYLKYYKASIYVDANIKILKDPIGLFYKYLESSSFLAIKHVERDCIYSEALSCIASKGTDYKLTMNQMVSYAKKGYPTKNNLTENRILFRSHNDKQVISLMEMWWNELNTWAQRDQLSLCFAAWKLKFKIGFISENPRFENDYFKWFPHKKTEKWLFYRLIRKLKFYGRWVLIYPSFAYRVGIIGKGFFNKSS